MTAFDVPQDLRRKLAWAQASHDALANRIIDEVESTAQEGMSVPPEIRNRRVENLRQAMLRLRRLQRQAGEILRRPA